MCIENPQLPAVHMAGRFVQNTFTVKNQNALTVAPLAAVDLDEVVAHGAHAVRLQLQVLAERDLATEVTVQRVAHLQLWNREGTEGQMNKQDLQLWNRKEGRENNFLPLQLWD